MACRMIDLYEKGGVTVRVGIDNKGRLNIELFDENDDEQSFDVRLPSGAHEELFEYLRHNS
jgi:hypothetical protein